MCLKRTHARLLALFGYAWHRPLANGFLIQMRWSGIERWRTQFADQSEDAQAQAVYTEGFSPYY